jgi:Predicted AAA-ATPase/PD-(D/E)XK nuclease superfamily
VLIDEYDKPIIDYLGTPQISIALENRDIFKSFYSILKDADPHLELVLITGVSKFSRVSIFSDLNNLTDLTLDKSFNAICGISQQELEANFAKELQETDNEEIRRWYNGYSFGGANTVYNPFSLLHFFRNNEFKNYWFESGTPTFLINLARQRDLYDFEKISVDSSALSAYDIERVQIIPLMFQTGYLTIKSYEDGIYELDYPNLEVRQSYLNILSKSYIQDDVLSGTSWANEVKKVLNEGQVEKLEGLFNVLFKSIPYELWQKQNEPGGVPHYYHAIIHLTFRLLGIYIESQVHSSDGRLDALVQTKDYVYCFEFKLNGKADIALKQIKDKGYLTPYLHSGKTCIGIGLNFSKKLKKVEKILWEEMKL